MSSGGMRGRFPGHNLLGTETARTRANPTPLLSIACGALGTPHAVAAAGNCLDQLPLSTQGSEPPGWLADGVLINLRAAMARLPELSAKELETEWRAGPCLKLAPGTYAAQLPASGLIVINGFYGRCATGHAHSSPSPSRSAATAPWTSP